MFRANHWQLDYRKRVRMIDDNTDTLPYQPSPPLLSIGAKVFSGALRLLKFCISLGVDKCFKLWWRRYHYFLLSNQLMVPFLYLYMVYFLFNAVTYIYGWTGQE